MDVRLRSRAGVAAMLVVALSTAALVPAGRDGCIAPDIDAHPAECDAECDAERGDVALAAPPYQRQRSESRNEGENPFAQAMEASTTEPPPLFFLGSSDIDDPALPKERVNLVVTLVDSDDVSIPRAGVEAVWGEWRTKTYTTDAEGHVTMSVPRGVRSLEVVGVPTSETRNFLLLHTHSLDGDAAEARVVVTRPCDIVIIEASAFAPPLPPPECAEIRGRVFDAFGCPATAAHCAAFSGSDRLASVLTNDDGVYSMFIPRAPGTRVQISVRFPISAPTSRGVVSDVPAGVTEPTLYLEEIGPLEVNRCRRWNRVRMVASTGSQ